MSQQKPRQRGGRVLDKATPEQVMALARNLPLTHSVLEKALEDATPGRLGFLANLFEKENASRAESKRRRLPGQAGFPPEQDPGGIRPGAWPRSPPTGAANSWKAWNSSTGPRTSCSTATSAAARPTWPSRSACSHANA